VFIFSKYRTILTQAVTARARAKDILRRWTFNLAFVLPAALTLMLKCQPDRQRASERLK
jgi:hypothetical protein